MTIQEAIDTMQDHADLSARRDKLALEALNLLERVEALLAEYKPGNALAITLGVAAAARNLREIVPGRQR